MNNSEDGTFPTNAAAYAVQQRTQEFGIRMALGASPGKARKTVVWQVVSRRRASVMLYER